MSAPKGNKFASKKADDMTLLVSSYIQHIADGFSKKSFIDCDYRTIESHIEDDEVLHPLKKEIERAERIGRAEWERIGKEITTGKLRGNPATWIFTMKNKYPDEWSDKSEIDHTVNVAQLPTINICTKKNIVD